MTHPDGFLACPKCGKKLSRPKSAMIRGLHWACGQTGCSGWLPMYPETEKEGVDTK